ncbi:hypothetical protein GCM10009682_42970 [Luedemannella flava]|uniref:SigE family RNA polymerase sigma factor n=1 Tax=Luedemannella flava TaxID=349316 RepID=A0ABN2MDI8_9ACTN
MNDAFHELARRELGRHPAPPRDHAGDALRAGHAARGRRRARRTRLTEAVLSVVPALAPLLRRGRPDQPDDRPTQGILPGEGGPEAIPRRGKRDDEADFVAFAKASAHRLEQAAYLMCRDWHLAQDLTQATLIKIYLTWARTGRAGDDRYPYARTVLLRLLLDHKRLRRSSEVVADTNAWPPGIAEEPEPATRITLLSALGTLPPRDRAIVVLRYWEDQSVAATAEALGIREEVVRTRSARALATLRTRLGTDPDLLAH